MFTVPDLPYAYNALEPYIDEQTMRIHHDKHHAGYVKNLNAALTGQDALLSLSVEDILKDLKKVPDAIRTAVINNGGGHANHSMFWTVMTDEGSSGKPSGALAKALDSTFGSFEKFQEVFTKAAATRFGSGWAWLVKSGSALEVMSTPNQESPLSSGKTPVLCLDVWEHAYYLKYQNMRPDYIAAWWHVVNWKEVERRYALS